MFVYPEYKERARRFTVNFYDGDNYIFDSQIVEYGLSAIAPDNPLKSPDYENELYFIFDSWSTSFASVTEDLNVYSNFTSIPLYYKVTFIDEDGKILNTQYVEYGKDASDPIDEIDSEIEDGEYIYTITGWDKDFTRIKEETEVKAVYSKVKMYYTVRFYDDDQVTLLDEQNVRYKEAAIAPMDPTKPSTDEYRYEFAGWDSKFDSVTADLIVTATYNEYANKFTVTFLDGDGNIFDEQTVAYKGAAEVPNGIPQKTPTDNISYVFSRWDTNFDEVTYDLIVKPIFKEVTRKFKVLFLDEDGNILKKEEVSYGGYATAPKGIKVPESTDIYEYVAAWDKEFDNVTEDLEVNLYFEEVLRKFTYRFFDHNNNVLKEITAQYGTIIIPPTAPFKPMTEEYVYTFAGWDKEVAQTLTEDVDYYPVFDETIREYTIQFLDANGDLFYEESVPYGQDGTIPTEIPTKEGNHQYYYEFERWDSLPLRVRYDMIINPVFKQQLQTYKVTFVDEYDNVLKVDEVDYGTGAIEPDPTIIPRKSGTQQYSYTFAGWDKSFAYVTEDITVKTIYIRSTNKYTYTFYNYDGSIIKQVTAEYGTQIVEPEETPEKPSEDGIAYKFIGWDKVIADKLESNIEYTAQYKEIKEKFKVIFVDGDGRTFNTQTVEHGDSAKTPTETPTKLPTKYNEYEFVGWIEDYSNITGDLVVNPEFKEVARKYKVTFLNWDDSLHKEVYVEYGKTAEGKVATPVKTGYRFVKWNQEITYIEKDMIVKPLFVANYYDIIFDGNNADTTSTMPDVSAEYDSTVSLPSSTFTRKGYNFTGWSLNPDDLLPTYQNGQNIDFEEEGLTLYAHWTPIEYAIAYDLDGGTMNNNPSKYTIESETIRLNEAQKEDHEFAGWYLISNDELETPAPETSGDIDFDDYPKIDAIETGTIGNITLKARYKYAGYIKLKETSKLQMVYAEITSIIPIIERDPLHGEDPVYLMNVYLGQTIADLKNNFETDGLVFLDAEGNELLDTDIVRTGMQVVLKNDNDEVLDLLTVVLKGDTNGDGTISAFDYNLIANHVSNNTPLEAEKLLASLINGDTLINALDYNILANHISGKESLEYIS